MRKPFVLPSNWSTITAAFVAVWVAGCQTPATRTVTQEVRIPVATTPLKPEQVPTPPAPLGPRPSSLSAAADTLLAKVCDLEGYVLKADPLLRLSAGLPPKPLARYPECEGHGGGGSGISTRNLDELLGS